jgi:hypothetical protein
VFHFAEEDINRVIEFMVPAVLVGAVPVWLASRWSPLPQAWRNVVTISTLVLGFPFLLAGGGFRLCPPPVEMFLLGGVVSTVCLAVSLTELQKNPRSVLGWSGFLFYGWMTTLALHPLWSH